LNGVTTHINFFKCIAGCTNHNTKIFINTLQVIQSAIQKNALRVVQTAIHLEKIILVIYTTRNVKGAKNNNYGLYNSQ